MNPDSGLHKNFSCKIVVVRIIHNFLNISPFVQLYQMASINGKSVIKNIMMSINNKKSRPCDIFLMSDKFDLNVRIISNSSSLPSASKSFVFSFPFRLRNIHRRNSNFLRMSQSHIPFLFTEGKRTGEWIL